jgi:hypothetical protein
MQNSLKIIVILGLLSLANCAGSGAVSDGTVFKPEMVRPYAKWVQTAMNVDMSSLPITTASGTQLRNSLGLKGLNQARAMGAYLPGRIILNNVAWDAESLRSQSYLVHELVHHAQLISGRHYECEDAKERESYSLQNRWLVEHGDRPLVGQDFIDRISACHEQKVASADF